MEYERIDNVQTGIISPSKLRLKLLGPHNHRRSGGSNSSRTSPSKIEDSEYAKNSLLSAEDSTFNEEGGAPDFSAVSATSAPKLEASAVKLSADGVLDSSQGKNITETGHVKGQHVAKGGAHQVQCGSELSMIYPVRSLEEDSADYDSGHDNASTSSFEFHKGERILHNSIFGPFSRPVPSKWNDAEKWIVNRQGMQPNLSKKAILQSQGNRQGMVNWNRVAPEASILDQRAPVMLVSDTKQIDTYQTASRSGLEKLPIVNSHPTPASVRINGLNDQSSVSLPKDQKEARQIADTTTAPTVKSVSMRDMGTEMTPMTSQEPSRTGTPIGATTPIRSPTSSVPSTPRGGEPAPSPVEAAKEDESRCRGELKQLSETELQQKTKREIVALGVQLGKMNIAAWASKDEKSENDSIKSVDRDELEKIEFEARAAAWEEAEKSKHTARYKSEEIKIQAWESQQKAKIEAEIRRLEAQVEQMKARAQEKIANKLAFTRLRSEEKRAAAEARKKQQAAKTAEQVEYIIQTGRVPSSRFLCCRCFP